MIVDPYRAAAAGDADFASVVLLLHGDGADGGATFTDSSPAGYVPATNGNFTNSTTQVKFGTASFSCPKGNPLQYASGSNFNLSGGDFTIECWAYSLATSLESLFSRRAALSATGWCWTTSGLRAKINGAWSDTQLSYASGGVNAWTHYALCLSGTTLRAFVNGTLVSTKTGVTSFDDLAITVSIGQGDAGSENRFDGYFDDIRWTKGVARYTATFTPPTAAFPNSA